MKAVMDYIKGHPGVDNVVQFIINTAIVVFIAYVILRLSRKLFHSLQAKKTRINIRFTEKVFRFLVIFLSIMWIVMSNELTKSFGSSLFQSTAVIAAIAGFAAQPVLSDLICGIILTSTKPFGIGDRIELENGTAGIVKDMTLRHVVLQGMDSQIHIVPNSKMNGHHVKNLSYHTQTRSVDFHFSVSFETDLEQAKNIIRNAIMESPYSVPGKRLANGENDYAPIYFLSFKESCLDMATTAYYMPDTPTEVFKDDINTRVKKALDQNGIEIPYNYMNIVVGGNGGEKN